jgi:ABC-type lipoprotein release transport system permease subunit
MTDQATLLVAGPSFDRQPVSGWVFRDQGELLSEFDGIMQSKKAGASIIYGLLLAIALLALFDTQVLAIFRRQREIGTYIALGMTRSQVAGIFTVEGSFHSLLALAAAGVYGIPFLAWLHRVGIPMPEQADQAGIAISGRIIPVYGAGMVLATVLLVVVSSVIVSYLPSRKISRMSPTAAIKGKIQ